MKAGSRFGQLLSKNSGPVNFVPESCLPFTRAVIEKRLRKPETGVKDGL